MCVLCVHVHVSVHVYAAMWFTEGKGKNTAWHSNERSEMVFCTSWIVHTVGSSFEKTLCGLWGAFNELCMKHYSKMAEFDLTIRWSFSLVPIASQTCSHDTKSVCFLKEGELWLTLKSFSKEGYRWNKWPLTFIINQ